MCDNILMTFYSELEKAVNIVYEGATPRERAYATHQAMKKLGITPKPEMVHITCPHCGDCFNVAEKWQKEHIVDVVYEIIQMRKEGMRY